LQSAGGRFLVRGMPRSSMRSQPSAAMPTRRPFEKTSLVAKLKAARDRKKAATGKCGGRRSYFELARMKTGGMSLRKISAELAAQGHLTGGGNRRCSG
jgi:hypothetical protein